MLGTSPLATCTFVAVDLETTGCRPGRNSIIEIGAVRFGVTGAMESFQRLVRPDETIPYAVESLTGITDSMVRDGAGVSDAVADFSRFADGAVLVAHNYRFDLSFLDHELELTAGRLFQRPVIDTLSLARRLRPDTRRFSLSALAAELGTPTAPDHRAGADARATGEILRVLLADVGRFGIRTVGELAAFSGLDGQERLTQGLALTRDITDEAGVFLFRDDKGRVIYVGHAKSLRLRTRQYFYAGSATDRLAREVASITAVATPSQLDAALIERRLVDRHRPAFNPAAHRSRAAYLIKLDTDSPYPAMRVVEAPRKRGPLIGPFTSRWTALTLVDRLNDEYDLRQCARRLGARLALTPCDARESGTCPAPCVTPLDRTDYAARVAAALAVFDDSSAFRARLEDGQSAAAQAGRYEDAIRYRDGVRALDRAISARSALREAITRDAVFVEEHDGVFVVSFIRGGLRAAVLRGERDWIAPKLPTTVQRVFFDAAPPADVLHLGPEKLGELLAIAAFAADGVYLEITVGDQPGTVARLRRAIGVDRRLPRRRHEVASIC